MSQTRSFEFITAGRIIFGRGKNFGQLGELVSPFGKNVLLVYGLPEEKLTKLEKPLLDQGILIERFKVLGEPTLTSIQAGVRTALEIGAEVDGGNWGGSALDTGKAVAALATNPGEVLDYLEVIGKGKSLSHTPLPYIAVSTTSGTGAEVTKNAVIKSEEHLVKVSLRSSRMFPTAALLDPELTLGLPPEVTASTGMDALTQVLEPYVSIKSNPFTDAFCLEGMQRASWALKAAYQDGMDLEARENMQLVSLFGGLALANAGLGRCMGSLVPLGGMFPAPHGAVCARLLPFVIEANVNALQEREPQNPVLSRYLRISELLTGNPGAAIPDLLEWIKLLTADLSIPGLSVYGIREKDLPLIVEKSKNASSMKGNPIVLEDSELLDILEKAL